MTDGFEHCSNGNVDSLYSLSGWWFQICVIIKHINDELSSLGEGTTKFQQWPGTQSCRETVFLVRLTRNFTGIYRRYDVVFSGQRKFRSLNSAIPTVQM